MAFSCSAAFWYHLRAPYHLRYSCSFRYFSARPSSYMKPSRYCASAFPFSADSWKYLAAQAYFRSPKQISASTQSASALPCVAAFR